MKTIFLFKGLLITCPTYPDDVITAQEGSVIHVTFCFEGLDDDDEDSYRFKILILKSVTEDSLHIDYDILCDVDYNHEEKTFVPRDHSICSTASGPPSLVLTMNVSRQNEGHVISLESYRSGTFTAPGKLLLLNITSMSKLQPF